MTVKARPSYIESERDELKYIREKNEELQSVK